MMLKRLGNSELSIHLADKIDEMDRSWEWFTNSFRNICLRKVRYLAGRVENEIYRFWLRMFRKFVYYVVVLVLAFLLTRDDLTQVSDLTEDWLVELDTNMKVPEYSKHFQAYMSLFLIVIIIFGV